MAPWKKRLKAFLEDRGLEYSSDIHECAHQINKNQISIINNVDCRTYSSLKDEISKIIKRSKNGCDISIGVSKSGAALKNKSGKIYQKHIPQARKNTSTRKSTTQNQDKKFYGSWQWKKLRFEVLKHYGAQCMLCGSTQNIRVDHIYPRSKFPDLEMDFQNMQVLCHDCNMGKSNNDYTDFRPKI